MPETEVKFCWQWSMSGWKSKNTVGARGWGSTVVQQSNTTGLCALGYPWDIHVLTSVLESHCCFLIIRHWMVDVNTGRNCQHSCHINACHLTLQAELPGGPPSSEKAAPLWPRVFCSLYLVSALFLTFLIAKLLLSNPVLPQWLWYLLTKICMLMYHPLWFGQLYGRAFRRLNY